MIKQISIFNAQFESLVESINEADGKYVIRTHDDRFFLFGENSVSLLNRLETATANEIEEDEEQRLAHFIEKVLLPKGIYQTKGARVTYKPKKPTLSLHFEILNASMVNQLCKGLVWLFIPLVVLSVGLISLVAHVSYFTSHLHVFSYEYILSYTPIELATILVLSLITSFFHELGHASCCKRLSGKAGGIGFGMNFFIPVFYANVSNLHILPKSKKAAIAISGIYLQFAVATLFILLEPYFPAVEKYLVLNLIGICFNLIPFFRNDGYWLLNDLSKKDDLLSETFSRMKRLDNIEVIHVIYALLLVTFFAVSFALMANFSLFRGPDIIEQLLNQSIYSFSAYLKGGLVLLHYLVIAISLFLLIRHVGNLIILKFRNLLISEAN